jgi:hypothetical protein
VAPDATYNALATELAHSYETTLAGDQQTLADDQALYRANQGKLDASENPALTNIRNRANAEGLLSSGIEQQRTGLQQAAFTRSNAALTTGFQQNQDRINQAMAQAGQSYRDRMVSAGVQDEGRRTAEAERQAEKNPTFGAPPPAAPAAPALPVVTGGHLQPITGSPARARRVVAKKARG